MMLRKQVCLTSLLLCLLGLYTNVSALEYEVTQVGKEQVLLLKGKFSEGDKGHLGRVLNRGRIDEVWFDSPGGNVMEGLEIGRRIRSYGLATRIPRGATCASICAFAFLGGVIREIESGGKYGVHMFSMANNKQMLERVTQLIRHGGQEAAEDIIMGVEQESAQQARIHADFLLEMSVSLRLLFPNYDTSHDSVYWLNRSELVSYNVVNSGY